MEEIERGRERGQKNTMWRTLFVCVCVRKIVAELTSMPIFLYFMWDAATAWLDEPC